jgi:hypothetical protein
VRKVDNLPPSRADVKKSGGLNLLEPCRPVQACNVTALLLRMRDTNNTHTVPLGTARHTAGQPLLIDQTVELVSKDNKDSKFVQTHTF